MICNATTRWMLFLAVMLLITQTCSASAWVKINPLEGSVGASLRVTGGGFTPNSNLGIFFGEKIVTIAKTDLNGGFSARFDVPEISCGLQKVMVVDEVKNNAYTSFNVTPKITKLSSKEGRPGSTITITGKGFSADSNVEIVLSNLFDVSGMTFKEVLAKKIVKTNEKGTFETNFEIPDVPPGYYLIYAKDPVCGLETEYTKFEILEPKITPTPAFTPTSTPTPKETVIREEEVKPSENLGVAQQTPTKTPMLKVQKSTPGFEIVIAIGGITIAFLISRRQGKI